MGCGMGCGMGVVWGVVRGSGTGGGGGGGGGEWRETHCHSILDRGVTHGPHKLARVFKHRMEIHTL